MPRNVVFFIPDGQRQDALGCYGNRLIRTPNVDAFAGEAVRFDQAFCPHSVCMPTRASIYTGQYPHVHGVWANGVPLARIASTLPAILAAHGYATGAAGKVHFEPQQPYAGGFAPRLGAADLPYYGFEEVHLSENRLGQEYLDDVDREFPELANRARRRDRLPEAAHDLHWITSQAIDFTRRQAAAGKPFFCHCSFHELIPPCTPPETHAGRYRPEDVPIPELRAEDLDRRPPFYRQCYEGYLARGRQPDEATLRRYIASYYDQGAFIDKQFGRLVAALRQLGIWEDTLVLYVADHGLSLNDHYQWRHGPFLFDQVIRVPMICRIPGAGSPGSACDALVEQVDILPTVLDWCGVAAPPGVQGHSLLPLLRGDPDAPRRDSVLIQERQAPDLEARGLDPAGITQIGVRTRDWKLIHYAGAPYGELYDLRHDPGEFANLWADPGYRDRRDELQRLLIDRLHASAPPLPERRFDW